MNEMQEVVSEFIQKYNELQIQAYNNFTMSMIDAGIIFVNMFSVLPPSEMMNQIYYEAEFSMSAPHIILFGTTIIQELKTQPNARLMTSIKNNFHTSPVFATTFIIAYIEAFHGSGIDEFITIISDKTYASDWEYIDFANICLSFIMTTRTKPDPRLYMRLNYYGSTQKMILELYESWIEIFSESPPKEILAHVLEK
jgi:hypothetical protein